MSFELKKKVNNEIDEFNIKSHLNTSLEAEGISMSEDLIRRTMDAIRLQDAKGSDTAKDIYRHTKPIFNRQARTLVTVAAAALILIAGLSALRTLSPIGMKGESTADDSVKNDDADGGRRELLSTVQRAPEEANAVNENDEVNTAEFKMAAALDKEDSAKEINIDEEQASDMIFGTDAVDNGIEKEENPLNDDVAYTAQLSSFTDIALIEAADVKEFKLSIGAASDTNIIADKEKINKFYLIMGKYSYLQSAEADSNIHYTVNIIAEDKESRISFGDTTLIVDIVQDDTVTHGIYSTDDHSMLLRDLDELLEN